MGPQFGMSAVSALFERSTRTRLDARVTSADARRARVIRYTPHVTSHMSHATRHMGAMRCPLAHTAG
jgi:hypothetical protein